MSLPPPHLADPRPTPLQLVLAHLRQARFADGLRCPRCGHRRVHRWGTFAERQRYRCLGCRRTFSDLTATPAAYIKKLEAMVASRHCLAEGLTLRAVAERLDVHPSTAFRWRHRLCGWLREHDRDTLAGWIELVAYRVPESHKGRHEWGRPGRQRGVPPDRLCDDLRLLHVVVAMDRRGAVVSAATPVAPRLRAADLETALAGRLETRDPPAEVVLGAGAFCEVACRRWTRRAGVGWRDSYRRVRTRRGGRRSLADARRVHDYVRRLRRWLMRFRGVATKYLPNYLAWHRRVDLERRHGVEAAVLRWPEITVR